MKNNWLKKIFTISIIVTVISCVFLSKPTFADKYTSPSLSDIDSESSGENANSLLENGTVSTTTGTQDSNGESGTEKTEKSIKWPNAIPLRILVSVLSIFPFIANKMLSLVAGDNFTIWKLLTNKITVTDIDFWKSSSEDWINIIRNNVAIWYYSVRNIAIVGMMVVLIYIGLRMAMLTIAGGDPRDQAKYKKLFINWLVGFSLTIILHYVLIFAIQVADLFTKIIIKVFEDSSTNTGIENDLVNSTWSEVWSSDNKHPFWEFIIYCFLVYYQFKFFWIYVMRALKIYFYIIISPLVCMTYSIDKIKDNKSQTLDRWVAEFLTELLMQPIQLLTYTIFIVSMDEILKESPILLIFILMTISNINKTISKLLLGRRRGRFSMDPQDVKNPLAPPPRKTVSGFIKGIRQK